MIPGNVEEVFEELGKNYRRPPLSLIAARAIPRPRFPCGHNPYVNYFKAGERALWEALVFAQHEVNSSATRDTELAEFYGVVRKLALRESREFCDACNYRGCVERCRYGSCAQFGGQSGGDA